MVNTHSRSVAWALDADAHYDAMDRLEDAVDRLARDPHEAARALLDARCPWFLHEPALDYLGLDETADEATLASAIAAHGLPDFGEVGNRAWWSLLADRVGE